MEGKDPVVEGAYMDLKLEKIGHRKRGAPLTRRWFLCGGNIVTQGLKEKAKVEVLGGWRVWLMVALISW
jgi:hypothetical protein